MQITWWLNAAQLYVTGVGAFLIVVYLWRSRRIVDQWLTPEGRLAYAKHSRLLIGAVGLLTAWFVLQYLALIFL